MFKNSPFKVSVDSIKWLRLTAIRCVRTFASSVVALIPTTAMTLGSVSWGTVFSGAALSAVVIFFTCLAGIPECAEEGD